jgi:hypothetical protein
MTDAQLGCDAPREGGTVLYQQRHCERSEAIQNPRKERLDCFVANAARKKQVVEWVSGGLRDWL